MIDCPKCRGEGHIWIPGKRPPLGKQRRCPDCTPLKSESSVLIQWCDENPEKAAERILQLKAIIQDILFGDRLDEYGNRDENGLISYPDLTAIITKLKEALK